MTFESPFDVSFAILDKAKASGLSVTPMQMQKLLYFVNGWFLESQNGRELFQNKFEAWTWGPVMPDIYHYFKSSGKSSIQENNDYSLKLPISDLIEQVLRIYGSLDGVSMSMLTHKQGTPWSEIWNGGMGKGFDIPSQLIRDEFVRIRSDSQAA